MCGVSCREQLSSRVEQLRSRLAESHQSLQSSTAELQQLQTEHDTLLERHNKILQETISKEAELRERWAGVTLSVLEFTRLSCWCMFSHIPLLATVVINVFSSFNSSFHIPFICYCYQFSTKQSQNSSLYLLSLRLHLQAAVSAVGKCGSAVRPVPGSGWPVLPGRDPAPDLQGAAEEAAGRPPGYCGDPAGSADPRWGAALQPAEPEQ